MAAPMQMPPGSLQHLVWPGGLSWNTQAFREQMPDNAARQIVNFFPHESWLEMRAGYAERWNLSANAVLFLPVAFSDDLFAATASTIEKIALSAADDSNATIEVSGLSSGDWSFVNTQTPAGPFFVCVNGADAQHIYDGAAWHDVSAGGSFAVTGVDTSKLSHVWAHKQRLWFIEAGTMTAWYSDPDAVAGTYYQFPITSIFRKGGQLLSGTTFSMDTGSGLDDRCVFFTDHGEIAVYEGTNPADANAWRLAGVYQSAPLLHKTAFYHVAGDVWLLTREGIISLTAIIQSGEMASQAANYVKPIADEWDSLVTIPQIGTRWSVGLTPDQRFLLISPASAAHGTFTLAMNPVTRQLAKITGWPLIDRVVKKGRSFSLGGSKISELNVTGQDAGQPFEAAVCAGFKGGGDLRAKKIMRFVDARFEANTTVIPTLGIGRDLECYDAGDFSSVGEIVTAPEWDAVFWDEAYWASPDVTSQRHRVSLGGLCRTFSPFLSVRSDQAEALKFRVHSLAVWYRQGNSL